MRLKKNAGVTLTELIVSMGIGTVLVTMTMQSLLIMSEGLTRIQNGATANDEAKLLNDFVSTSLVAVGGGPVRPWMALWVEDDAAGQGSDRITWATLVDSSLQCPIGTLNGSDLSIITDGVTCCLTDDFLDRQVMLLATQIGSSAWINRTVTEIDLLACTLTLGTGHATILDEPGADDSVYTSGVVTAVSTSSVYVDHTENFLMLSEDYDIDGILDSRILADRVFDLQAALGYDIDPWDWKINETQGTDDEWLYNASGDTFALGDGQGLGEASLEELRMVSVGIVVGAPTSDTITNPSLSLLNGPDRQEGDWLLRGVVSIVGLRNYDIMR